MGKQNVVYGPFELINESRGDGRTFLSVPFATVVGAQALIGMKDNFAAVTPASITAAFWAAAEITIWGVVQGYETCLKRQHVRMATGPMVYIFPYEEAYESILFRGVNLTGGHPGVVDGVGAPSSADSFSMAATVFFQPRSGFATDKAVGR